MDLAQINYLRGFAAGVASMWQHMADLGYYTQADQAVVAALLREEVTLPQLHEAHAPIWDLSKIEAAVLRVPGASLVLIPAPSVASR